MSKKKLHTFTKPFITESGCQIPEPKVAYQTWGTLNSRRTNTVVVCHALTGDTAASEWFGGLFGPGKVLDPDRHFIICINAPGSCCGSSGPASINPKSGKKYQADFPRVTIRDMVRLQQKLLDELQISEIKLVIGGSMGGMQALEWCIMDDRPQSAVLMGMGKNHSPWAVGISHAQRQTVYSDANWNSGYYSEENQPEKGMAAARMIAMNSYRSPVDFGQKFGRLQDESGQFQIESYLNYQGEKLAKRFDAVSYVRLTQAMDSHDVARNRGSYEQVLEQIQIPTLVIGIDSDMLYPVQEQHELVRLLPDGRYRELKSTHGHDAFLIEFEKLNKIITPFLMETPTSLTIPV